MKRSKKLTILALILGMVGALLATAGVAFGDQSPGGGGGSILEEGVLFLHLDSDDDYFRFDSASDSGYIGGPIQAIPDPNKCVVAVDGQWASLEAPSFPLGFRTHEFGVKKGGKTGTPCSQVNGIEEGELVLALAGDLADFEIDFFEVDVELKFEGSIKAELFNDGLSVGEEFLDCTGLGADCGSDSTNGDNVRWRVPSPGGEPVFFDEIRFSNVDPDSAFSLGGGNDGTPAWEDPGPDPDIRELGQELLTLDSVFHVVDIDGILDCESNGGFEASEGDGQGGTVPDVNVDRADNFGTTCVPVAFNLDTSGTGLGQDVTFAPVLGTQQGTQFLLELLYEAVEVAAGTGNHPPIVLEYDDGSGYRDVRLCNFDPRPVTSATDPTQVLPAALGEEEAAETACLVEAHYTILPSDGDPAIEVESDYVVYTTGDPSFGFK